MVPLLLGLALLLFLGLQLSLSGVIGCRGCYSTVNNTCNGTTRFVYFAAMADNWPLAYLITFRCHGTWLHGDERGSVDRFHNQYGTPCFPSNQARLNQNNRRLNHAPVTLTSEQRHTVEEAIRETCDVRKWTLKAVNARTNHVHTVVSALVRPELVLNALKANATRQMRQTTQWPAAFSPWSDSGSKRYVWTELGVERAIDYVLNAQDGAVPELDPPKRNRQR